MLRNVADIDLSTSVLGQRVSMPICVGATAMQCMAHVDGELATVRGRKRETNKMPFPWCFHFKKLHSFVLPSTFYPVVQGKSLSMCLVFLCESGLKPVIVAIGCCGGNHKNYTYKRLTQSSAQLTFLMSSNIKVFKNRDLRTSLPRITDLRWPSWGYSKLKWFAY